MRRAKRVSFSLLILALCAASSSPDTVWRDRGAATVLPFKQRLLAELTAALEKGPENALEVCRVRAPALALEASSPGLRVGRTSERLRNPANAPADWVKPILADYAARPTDREPRVVRLAANRIGYTEPIYVAPMCLTCHGEAIAAPLQDRLHALYPQDQATGFRAGDFRGVFWIEFDDTPTRPEARP